MNCLVLALDQLLDAVFQLAPDVANAALNAVEALHQPLLRLLTFAVLLLNHHGRSVQRRLQGLW